MDSAKEKNVRPVRNFKSEVIDFLKFALVFGAIFFGVRSLVYDYFIIPSSSMFPTLLIGDMPLVEKWPYGYSKHSFWFSPDLFTGRKLKMRDVKRGEVIVFKAPYDTSINVIKRVIGLPKDRIRVENGVVIVNDQKAELTFMEPTVYVDDRDHSYRPLKLYEERLPFTDENHVVAYDDDRASESQNHMQEIVVPDGFYFVMGDHRDYSKDSRCGLGMVPEEHVMGRAVRIIYSIANGVRLWEPHLWLQNIRYNRLLKKII